MLVEYILGNWMIEDQKDHTTIRKTNVCLRFGQIGAILFLDKIWVFERPVCKNKFSQAG